MGTNAIPTMQQLITDMFVVHNISRNRLKHVTFFSVSDQWQTDIVFDVTWNEHRHAGVATLLDTRIARDVAVIEFQTSGKVWNFTKLYGEVVELGEPYIQSPSGYIEQLAIELRASGFVNQSGIVQGSLHYGFRFSIPSPWKLFIRMMNWR